MRRPVSQTAEWAAALLALAALPLLPVHAWLLLAGGGLWTFLAAGRGKPFREKLDATAAVLRWPALALLSAFAWQTPLLFPECGFWLPLSLLLLLGLLAIGQLWSAPRPAPALPGWARALKTAAWLFALLVSAAVWALPALSSAPLAHGLGGLKGLASPGEAALLPGWLRGEPDPLPLPLFALAAWTLAFGVLLALREKAAPAAGTPKEGRLIARILMAGLGLWPILFAALGACAFGFTLAPETRPGAVPDEALPAPAPEAALRRMDLGARLARAQGAAAFQVRFLEGGMALAWAHGDTARAALFAARLATLDPARPEPLLALGSLLFQAGRRDAAFHLFRPEAVPDADLRTLQPENPAEAFFLADLLRDRNEILPVVLALRPFVRLPPAGEKPPPPSGAAYSLRDMVAMRYGDFSLFAGDLDEAARVADALLAAAPRNTVALALKGVVQYERGEIDAALTTFYGAFRIDPNNYILAANLGRIYALKENAEALPPLRRAVLTPFPSNAWRGPQGRKLYLPGEAYLQAEFWPGPTHLQMAASAAPAKGEWPVMELWVNGVKMAATPVESPDPAVYTFEFVTRRGPNRIAVRYANDYADSVEDRNLFLGHGYFEPVFYLGQKW